LRPVLPRNDFRAGLANPSADGGWDELVEFIPNRRFNSAFSARSRSLSARSSATSTRNLNRSGIGGDSIS
jgi:hypothetical protein